MIYNYVHRCYNYIMLALFCAQLLSTCIFSIVKVHTSYRIVQKFDGEKILMNLTNGQQFVKMFPSNLFSSILFL